MEFVALIVFIAVVAGVVLYIRNKNKVPTNGKPNGGTRGSNVDSNEI